VCHESRIDNVIQGKSDYSVILSTVFCRDEMVNVNLREQ
jgi:hypothetical protein